MRRPWPIARRRARRSSALLVYSGLQLNPAEAQVKDMPGSGDAIAGRTVLADAGHLARRDEAVRRPRRARRPRRRRSSRSFARPRASSAPSRRAAWRKGGDSLIEAFPATDGDSNQVQSTTIERGPAPRSRGTDATLGGVAAEDRDFVDAVYSNFPYVLAFVVLLTLILLDAGVPLARPAAEGRRPEPALARGRLRDHRVHLPVGPRLGGDLERRGDPVDHPLDPADDLRLPVRALDGLRGLHADADARGLRRDGRHATRRSRSGSRGPASS